MAEMLRQFSSCVMLLPVYRGSPLGLYIKRKQHEPQREGCGPHPNLQRETNVGILRRRNLVFYSMHDFLLMTTKPFAVETIERENAILV